VGEKRLVVRFLEVSLERDEALEAKEQIAERAPAARTATAGENGALRPELAGVLPQPFRERRLGLRAALEDVADALAALAARAWCEDEEAAALALDPAESRRSVDAITAGHQRTVPRRARKRRAVRRFEVSSR